MDACLECGAGDHTSVASKATTCSSCDGGTYSEGLAVNCSVCAAGTASSGRASSCLTCSSGYFAASANSDVCLKCSSEVGYEYTSSIGSATCDRCVKDWYMADNGKCKSKDKGVVAKDEGTTLETLELEGGYYRFSRTSAKVYECTR